MRPTRTTSALLGFSLIALSACDAIPVDSPFDGGQAMIPTGVIEGTVTYTSFKPQCAVEDGVPTRVLGRAVLLLFRNDNPPAPEGGATTSLNLLFVNGDQLFTVDDCRTDPSDLSVITRSAPFVWPSIPLSTEPANMDGEFPGVAYQIRAAYDADESFNPFFSVRTSPTRGDVAGGAFVDVLADPLIFRPIELGNVGDQPNGQVVDGVSVTLAAPVSSELPAFTRAPGATALEAEATTPLNPDPAVQDEQLWQLMRLGLTLIDPLDQDYADTLAAAGMSLDPSPLGRGFFAAPLDNDRDGVADLHPILGSNGVPWLSPIVLLQRARTPTEVSVGIPAVSFVATVRPGLALPPVGRTTFSPTMPVSVPPVALVTLRPDLPECAIAYVAPGSFAESYEAAPTECQELPTGNYDLVVLGGLAGARPADFDARLQETMPDLTEPERMAMVAARTDTGIILEGGTFASQTWGVPNELGCPDAVYDPTSRNQLDPTELACGAEGSVMRIDQGPNGRVSVVDTDVANAPAPDDTTDGRGIASCQTTLRLETMALDAVSYMDVPPACCAGLTDFCRLPLCETDDRAVVQTQDGTAAIRELGPEDLDANGMPTCLPFLMPVSCCRG